MNTLLQWMVSPLGGVLWKCTALLALGWAAHGCLRRGHPRWRLMLWRGILILSLPLSAVSFLSLPAITIPVQLFAPPSQPDVMTPAPKMAATSVESTSARPSNMPVLKGPGPAPIEHEASPRTFPWKGTLLSVWALGCACGVARLIWLHAQLMRLHGSAEEPPLALAELAREIQKRLDVRRGVRLRISGAIHSPFVCGVWRPVIVLPRSLVATLSNGQIVSLLRHEMAHLRGNDLLWSAGWRWLQVIGWFHPLVWRVAAAHSFACEQEADRVACGASEELESYAQFLAQLTLRVLALPKAETELTLNGSAQIVRRLQHLQRAGLGAWTRKHTAAGLGLVGFLFLIAVSCRFANSNTETNHPAGGFKQVLVEVQDTNGKPIEGAQIAPFGFRVKGRHSADGYGWRTNVFGPKETAITGPDGRAYVRYAVMGIPEEKEYTGALIFSVTHTEYSTVTIQDYPVDETNAPIQMVRGGTLMVAAYYGGQRVTDLVPNLADEGVRAEDWLKQAGGILVCHKLSPGGHLIQLMGRLPSGEIVYSGTALVTVTPGKVNHVMLEMNSEASGVAIVMGKNEEKGLLTFDMKPGIRLEGRLEDAVPRPVKNGRVMIDIRPPEYPATNVIDDFYDLDAKYGGRSPWHSYRPINADGTFVFESVPPGEADVVVLGDGFATKSEGQLYDRYPDGAMKKNSGLTIPQSFPLTAPVTSITVKTEPTATLEFTATNKKGQPIDNVWVGMFPSAFRMRGMYGWTRTSSEAPFREIAPLPDLRYAYSGQTGPDGMLVIRNIPAEAQDSLDIDSEHYQVPLQDPKGWRDRHVRTQFEPGMTNSMVMVMEPKGKDYVGTAR
ncbi:MAG TPA: M56 family metallopeptidase [Verrucomicrobiae bacterium]|nr:M56 family metallopeptidase [Verrucomicrobiae bacterium]